MRKFNIIKKSRKKSKDIDEKIEYLDKECQKTGLQEFMTTSNIYQGSTKVPNQDYSAFQALNVNGYGLALSGADGNSINGASVENHLGVDGVAMSPPHPVTGVRTQALHVRDGLGGTTPLRPGAVIKRGFADNAPDYTMGSAMWFYFPTHNNGEGVPPGKWCNFEYGNFPNNSGWGFWDTIKTGQFAGLHVFNRTTSQHPCGDINLATKIASINFGENGTVGAPQTIVLTQKDLDDPGHLPIPFLKVSKQAFDWLLDKANKALGFEGDNLATKIEKTKDAFINFIGMTNPIAKLLASIPVFDYASEILTSLILNEPIYKGNDDVSMEDKQNYIKGIAPGYFLDGPNSIPKSNNEKPYSDGNIYKDPNTNQVVAHTEESKKQFPDNTSTFSQTNLGALPIKGGDGTSFGNTVNLDPFMITNKISARGNMQTQIVEPEDGSEVYLKVHDFAYLNEDKINDSGELPSWLQQGIAKPLINLIDKFHGRKSGAENTGAMSGFSSNIHGASELEFVIPFSQWTKEQQDAYNKSKNKSVSESLNEAVKLGHFDPQVLNVDINNIRKGIMPEFPKDPPPEMINGYSAKSKLAPKKVELPPFIKVTRKDLAQNHKLTDKEIQDFLDDVNKINEYIKNNPADLKYAMIRYPKDDPRLAQLNWQMDQMKAASEEYMETHFPENQKLFSKLQDKIIRNIKQTDPKNYTGHKEAPKFTDDNIKMSEQRKQIALKHFKKPVKIKKLFKR